MQFERRISISEGGSRRSTEWTANSYTIEELYKRLENPSVGSETYNEYLAMKKPQQDALKDVGGFVGGTLNGNRRKANCVTGRDLITLDFDNIPGWQTEALIQKIEGLGCSYCVYSTRKHAPNKPRLRFVVPTDRTMTPDEYEPCARRIAHHIGIEMADPTTFEVARLMYWPSRCSDAEYVYKAKDAPLISVEFLLSTYVDWHDFLSWPKSGDTANYRRLAARQSDPEAKPGIVGAFCRTYDIYAVLEELLPGLYVSDDSTTDRYTYCGGSTTGGAIVYDNGKYLFSHHATDPCSGKLVNAFDLVRIHKFGTLDEGQSDDSTATQLPSYKAMCDFAKEDSKVRSTIAREQHEQTVKDFSGISPEPDNSSEWAENLQITANGGYQKCSDNFKLILMNDPQLKGRMKIDTFAHRTIGFSPLPWGNRQDSEGQFEWNDADDAGLRMYIEKYYKGLRAENMLNDALCDCLARNSFNPVQSYINSLVWDGVERLDTLLIDYLGAEDTPYVRAVTRKSFTAAIGRAMRPGSKFDNMLILAGPQGIGKSTLLGIMGGDWFNDSIRTFEGKNAAELLQGVWIIEIAELDAFRRADVATIKQFLSIRADRYRAAYGRRSDEYSRTCVFFGTTNTTDFLQDTTGNRRFWPVDVGAKPATKDVFSLLPIERNQIWAEAKMRYESGEQLHLTGNIAEAALQQQEEHMDGNALEGIVKDFMQKQIPVDWDKMKDGVPIWPIQRRRDYWAGNVPGMSEIRVMDRDRICVAEIWCEALNRDISVINDKPSNGRSIGGILRRLECSPKNTARFGPYGIQKQFLL